MKLEELLFAKTHEWVKREGEMVTVGLTDYAQNQLGDVVFIEFPAIGKTYAQDTPCADIESVKAATPIYAPVSGEISAVNEELKDGKWELVNQSPYEQGWIYKMKNVPQGDLDKLMSYPQYEEYLKGLDGEH